MQDEVLGDRVEAMQWLGQDDLEVSLAGEVGGELVATVEGACGAEVEPGASGTGALQGDDEMTGTGPEAGAETGSAPAPLGGALWRGLGSRDLRVEVIEDEILVELSEVALVGDGEELVGEVHQDAVVAGAVLGEGGLELGAHEGAVAGGLEEVIEAGPEGVALGVVDVEAASDAASEREQVGVAEALG
ncbi:MAG: hypothetical protein KC619_28965 [Myxococcales bacterium]|nr:hypothetical protein [Myxococcales bacterium]